MITPCKSLYKTHIEDLRAIIRKRTSNFPKPSSCDWTDSLISTTLQMSDDSIRIADKCCITEWKITHWAPPVESKYGRVEVCMCMCASVCVCVCVCAHACVMSAHVLSVMTMGSPWRPIYFSRTYSGHSINLSCALHGILYI